MLTLSVMNRTVTKEAALDLLGGAPEAAEFFDIEPQAIYQWDDDELIPELRELQLRTRRPELFKKEARGA